MQGRQINQIDYKQVKKDVDGVFIVFTHSVVVDDAVISLVEAD